MSLGLPLFLSIMLGLIVIVVPTNAEARTNYDVGIALSKTCMIMHQNNMSSNCPTYEEILSVFPDTTNQDISGKFEYIDGVYQRGESKYKTNYGYYKFNYDVLWIDPPSEVRNTIAMITIENQLPDYVIHGVSNKMGDDNIQTLGHSRYIDDHCWRASVSAEDWLFLVGDTIQHLKAECTPDSTNFDNIRYIEYEKSYQDLATSYAFQLALWLDEVKKKCLGLCFEY